MRFLVREGCTLMHPDGTVWAQAGEVVEVDVDSEVPAERTAAQRSLRGQHAKVCAAPPEVSKRSDRSMAAPVIRGESASRKGSTKRKG